MSELKVALTDVPSNLNPYESNTLHIHTVMWPIYEPLFDIGHDGQLAGRRRPRHYDEASVPRTNVACGFPALRSTGWLPARRRAASSRIKFRRR